MAVGLVAPGGVWDAGGGSAATDPIGRVGPAVLHQILDILAMITGMP